MAPVQDPAPAGGNAEGWGPWEAVAAPVQGPVIAPGEDMPIDNQHLPPQDVNSGVTGAIIVQDWESDDDESVNEPEAVEEQGVAVAPQGVGIGEGLQNIFQNYLADDDEANSDAEEGVGSPMDSSSVAPDNDDWMLEDQHLLSLQMRLIFRFGW